MLLIWILGCALVVTVAGVGGAGLILVTSEHTRQRIMRVLVAYAAGALLAAALLGLIPEAVEHAPARSVLATVLAAVVACFVLEQVLVWRHCHGAPCEGHSAAVPLVLLGDGLHNFVDGAAIAAAFLDSVPLGLTTSLAILAHEIPQEIGDFAVLLDAGQPPRRALVLNLLSGLAAVAGALVGYVWLAPLHGAVPYVLGISAATFLYIALVDLLADFHHRVGAGLAVQRFVALAAGIGTIGYLVSP
jgi:zinc and cadmium transporter